LVDLPATIAEKRATSARAYVELLWTQVPLSSRRLCPLRTNFAGSGDRGGKLFLDLPDI
jgi:hypothetical protein